MPIGERLVRFTATDVEHFRALRLNEKNGKPTRENKFDVYFARVDENGQRQCLPCGRRRATASVSPANTELAHASR
jgi:hypothetical protein